MTNTPTTESAAPTAEAAATPPRKSGGALGGKVLAELKEIAADLHIEGAAAMRKGQLIDAIKTARGDAPKTAPQRSEPAQQTPPATQDAPREKRTEGTKTDEQPTEQPTEKVADEAPKARRQDRDAGGDAGRGGKGRGKGGNDETGRSNGNGRGSGQGNGNPRGGNEAKSNDNRGANDNRGTNDNRGGNDDGGRGDDEDGGSGRRRNRRGRGRGTRGPDGEPTYTEDDVLVPAAGILDILDNYAFVRTTGYLPSENDVYLSLSMVRKLGLRKGDAVTGQVRQPREGERKEKFNPMVRVDTVNGMTAEESRSRVDFDALTPLFPTERLVLETEPTALTTRVIDLVAPIGKGQRGLLLSPPKAGRTTVLQAVADAITTNNPECHLMVVLVDERPEEVTQMQRTVKGEVIASTFDRPAADHTTVAELAIERAKRLVELGHDVVVLLDSLTRLGRAYNLSAPASGRVLSGGVDASALYPPKKFFGAARNIEDGGSLTILATALVETGSRTDEVILEEFQGAATMELRLRSDLADQRIVPAIDVHASGTRREELLMTSEELAVVATLRRRLAGLEAQQGIELVLERLRKTSGNAELLRHASTAGPAAGFDED